MPTTILDAASLAKSFSDNLPTGPAWPKSNPASVLSQTVLALQPQYQRVVARGVGLIAEGIPTTTNELLPDWEASLGLPDPCAGESPTVEARRAQVVARFAGLGGQSIPFLIQYAANLGYTITITEYTPFRAGISRAGDEVDNAGELAFHWQVNAPSNTITYFQAGIGAAGDPLESFGNSVLECELRALAPAHTTLVFNYF